MSRVILNMADQLTGIMAAHNHPDKYTWRTHLPGGAEGLVGKHTDEQMHNVNRAFRAYLSALPVNTMSVRNQIDDHLSVNEWLTNYFTNVVPALVRLRGPDCLRT